MPIKPVLKVWCLPSMPEEALNKLHADLVDAVITIKRFGVSGENDIIVLFPPDMMRHGLGAEILVEYESSHNYLDGGHKDLELLSAKLGHVLRKHFPDTLIQCKATTRDANIQTYWMSSEGTVSREEVERARMAALKFLPHFQLKMRESCYCAENLADNKGPCAHCNMVAAYNKVIQDATDILGIGDAAEFLARASVYLRMCREEHWFQDISKEVGWE